MEDYLQSALPFLLSPTPTGGHFSETIEPVQITENQKELERVSEAMPRDNLKLEGVTKLLWKYNN